jgi:acyl-CoA dehydrogenase
MDFELPEELQVLKQNLRNFVDKEMIPIERGTLEGGRLKPDIEKRLKEKAKPLGLWLFDVPEELGGQGFGMMARVVVWEEVSRSIALPSRAAALFSPDVSPILLTLTGELKEKYLMPVLRGEKKSCFAQTEPDAGADPAGMRTRAEKVDGGYVINGSKRFITGAGTADFGQVFAKLKGEDGKDGVNCFLIDMKTPGIKLSRQLELMVDDKPWELFFENVFVPENQKVSQGREGAKLAQAWLNAGRLRHGARSAGVMERCLELACTYANQRKTFGAPLADRQLIQDMIADTAMELHQLRLMVYQAAWKFDQGQDIRDEAFMCKVFGDDRSFQAASRCMQIHGGMGLSKELPIERMFRDQRSMMITEGPNEVLKMSFARRVLAKYK